MKAMMKLTHAATRDTMFFSPLHVAAVAPPETAYRVGESNFPGRCEAVVQLASGVYYAVSETVEEALAEMERAVGSFAD